jgi:plasmid maintenance system antidote protein VapI
LKKGANIFLMPKFHEVLEQLLIDKRVNPEQLAKELRIPPTTLRNQIKKGANPKFEMVLQLSKHFGIKDLNFWVSGAIKEKEEDCNCQEFVEEIKKLKNTLIDREARLDELRREVARLSGGGARTPDITQGPIWVKQFVDRNRERAMTFSGEN